MSQCTAVQRGGGIYANSFVDILMDGSSVSDCMSLFAGGVSAFGELELRGFASISRCDSSNYGGAIKMESLRNTLRLTNARLCNNTALGGGGGAIAASGGVQIYLVRSHLIGNTAPSGDGASSSM